MRRIARASASSSPAPTSRPPPLARMSLAVSLSSAHAAPIMAPAPRMADRECPAVKDPPSQLVLGRRDRYQLPAVDRIGDDSHLCARSACGNNAPGHPLAQRLDLTRRAVQLAR